MQIISRFKFYITCCFIGISLTTSAIGRWALPEEAPVQVEFYNRDITVAADGKTEEVIEVKRKVLNEQGRNDFGTQTIIYNENSEEIHILEAKTIFQGQEYLVPESMIEKKPLASNADGFDQLMQVLIAYPKCYVGAQIYLKYKFVCLKQPLPNYFATEFHYGCDGQWEKSAATLNSDLPLNILVNDPKHKLDIQQTKNSLSIRLKEPLYESLTHEPVDGVLEEKYRTWVKVSSLESFEALAQSFAQGYEKVLLQSFPGDLEAIVNQTKSIVGEVDQINRVTSILAEKVRYMGDWRAIQGRFYPHKLEEIISTGVGDCKDFATCVTAILRNLGYEAYVVLVMRDTCYIKPEKQLPNTGLFNHAIVKVVGKLGKVYWIDPTNLASMANGIFPDIANRYALVLNQAQPMYEKISDIDSEHSRIEISQKITIATQEDRLSVIGTINLIGERAIGITGATLTDSPYAVKERILRNVCGELTPLSHEISLPDLTSRIVKDLEVKYSFEQKNWMLLTNKGQGIPLSSSSSVPFTFTDTSEEQICGIFLGSPMTFYQKTFIPDVQAENCQVFDFNITTPWISIARNCSTRNGGVEIEERIKILRSFIKSEELKSKFYLEAKNKIKQYFRNAVMIVTPLGSVKR